jgi:hypothetical protein
MKTGPFESNVMLAGLTRGLWIGAPAGRCQEHRRTLAGASSRRSPPISDAEMPGLTGEDLATGSSGSALDRRCSR